MTFLSSVFANLAFLTRGVSLRFIDERLDKDQVFHSDGGVVSFVRFLNQNKTVLHPDPVFIHGERNGVSGRCCNSI